jgi:hypothetical protein
MRDVFRTGAGVQAASSTGINLLLESLALRHQLNVLARSNRRFRPSDRLLWLLLRWLWPRWREALVLLQSATVDRWDRTDLRRCWRRRSRRPGRPRIDSTSRDLIRRLAAENHLWGAPRIHGELLKLGIAVSERTVSRYLQGHPTARSQTWRTFFANQLGDLAFTPPVMSSSAPDDDDVVDASGFSFHPVPLLLDGLCEAKQWAVVDCSGSRRAPCLGWRFATDHVHGHTGARTRTGRDPPRHLRLQLAARRTGRGSWSMPTSGLCDRQRLETMRALVARSRSAVPSLCLCPIESSQSPEGRSDVVRTPMSTCVIDSHVGGNIGEAQRAAA